MKGDTGCSRVVCSGCNTRQPSLTCCYFCVASGLCVLLVCVHLGAWMRGNGGLIVCIPCLYPITLTFLPLPPPPAVPHAACMCAYGGMDAEERELVCIPYLYPITLTFLPPLSCPPAVPRAASGLCVLPLSFPSSRPCCTGPLDPSPMMGCGPPGGTLTHTRAQVCVGGLW